MFAMSGDGKNDVTIPAVFLFYQDASQLLKAIQENPGIEISIADTSNIGNVILMFNFFSHTNVVFFSFLNYGNTENYLNLNGFHLKKKKVFTKPGEMVFTKFQYLKSNIHCKTFFTSVLQEPVYHHC